MELIPLLLCLSSSCSCELGSRGADSEQELVGKTRGWKTLPWSSLGGSVACMVQEIVQWREHGTNKRVRLDAALCSLCQISRYVMIALALFVQERPRVTAGSLKKFANKFSLL